MGAGSVAAGMTACSPSADDLPARERIAYGEDPSQYGDLHRPVGAPRGIVAVVHGGYWSRSYGLELGTPLAQDLAARGWLAWNVEYRRVGTGPGGGGGGRRSVDDVAAALAALDRVPDRPAAGPVVGVGHSAGGHLVACAAARPGSPLTAAVLQAGVLDLVTADAQGLGGGAVAAFLGHRPSAADADLDPIRQVPLAIPVTCVHGPGDRTVPLSQSVAYVDAARAAGGSAELVEVAGDHFAHLDPDSAAWEATLSALARDGR